MRQLAIIKALMKELHIVGLTSTARFHRLLQILALNGHQHALRYLVQPGVKPGPLSMRAGACSYDISIARFPTIKEWYRMREPGVVLCA